MLGLEFEVKVDMLGMVDVKQKCERLERALKEMMFEKGLPMPVPDAQGQGTKSRALVKRPEGQVSSMNSKPRSRAASFKPNGQKENSAPIPEDVQPLVTLLEQRHDELSPSALEVIQRELSRLVKIPSQSAEYGVVKTYIELLLALPWDRVSEVGEVDLGVAKEVLERDHEGLKEVKRRVVEYLAVYK